MSSVTAVFVLLTMVWLFKNYDPKTIEAPGHVMQGTTYEVNVERWKHDGQQPITDSRGGNFYPDVPWQSVNDLL